MILGFYGYHNSGKTALIEKLLKELTLRGYRVATVKNIPHEFSIDTEGKDTWRHMKSGACTVVMSSLNETAFLFDRRMDLDEITSMLSGYDIILVEGNKKAPIPKIAVGDIKEEKNTIFRYNDNLNEILEFIEKGV
jgi:molybdopterin-guanine dinucleotide biosynthesis protein B